jgi:zinc transport system substrate-binding protein
MKKLLLISLLTLLAACKQEPAIPPAGTGADGQARPTVVASNYPLYFFAREIAAGSVDVVLPDIEGDPAMWRPQADDVELLQAADRILLNGAGYESWLNWISLPASRLVDTSESFHDRLIPLVQETTHQHGPAGEHSHTGTAFSVWLDPELAIAQAQSIKAVISELAPRDRERHQENLAFLQKRLEEIHDAQQLAFKRLADYPILFSHPVYQYLERRYHLTGLSMHWEPDQAPGDKAWIDFTNTLRENPTRVMIWEDDPLPATRERLRNMGLTVIPYMTASNRPDNGDYFDVMAANLEHLKTAGVNTGITE